MGYIIKLIIDLILRFSEDDVPALASHLAYNLILSFFPFLIFLMTLTGYTSLNRADVFILLNSVLPEDAFNLIKTSVIEIINTKNSSLLSVSIILTIWSASSSFNSVIKGLNKAYGVIEKRSFIKVRIISMLCTLGLSLIIILLSLLLVFSKVIWNALIYRFDFLNKFEMLLIISRYIIMVSTTIFIFSVLYRYAPSKKLTWEEVCYGSIFSTFSLIFISYIFGFYVNNFRNYSLAYGSIGAIIILLVWLFLTSIIVILGGEINASLACTY